MMPRYYPYVRWDMKKTITYDVNGKVVESLVHHFENGVWMYRCDVVEALKKDLEDMFDKCMEVTPDMLKTNIFQRIIRAIVRIFAPML